MRKLLLGSLLVLLLSPRYALAAPQLDERWGEVDDHSSLTLASEVQQTSGSTPGGGSAEKVRNRAVIIEGLVMGVRYQPSPSAFGDGAEPATGIDLAVRRVRSTAHGNPRGILFGASVLRATVHYRDHSAAVRAMCFAAELGYALPVGDVLAAYVAGGPGFFNAKSTRLPANGTGDLHIPVDVFKFGVRLRVGVQAFPMSGSAPAPIWQHVGIDVSMIVDSFKRPTQYDPLRNFTPPSFGRFASGATVGLVLKL